MLTEWGAQNLPKQREDFLAYSKFVLDEVNRRDIASMYYDVTSNIDGCHIENPKGTLVSLREDTMTLRGSINNAHIRLKGYAGKF